MKFRNTSDDTVLDYITQQVVEPDGIFEVDDSLAEHYENHPVYEPVPDFAVKAAPAAKKEEA